MRRHVAGVAALITELRRSATDAELIRLGNRWEIAEEAAPTRPHPGTPGDPAVEPDRRAGGGGGGQGPRRGDPAADVPGGPDPEPTAATEAAAAGLTDTGRSPTRLSVYFAVLRTSVDPVVHTVTV